MPNTIILKAMGIYEEATAAGAIQPGALLEIDANGDVQNHSVAGGRAELMVALEDALQGRTIDDAYAVGDIVSHKLLTIGSKVQAILQDGETAVIGSPLYSNGDGTLVVTDPLAGSGVVIAVAQEAVDLSGAPAENGFVAVRVVAN